MEPSCSFTLHQSVLDLALLRGTLVTVARTHSFAPFRACAGRFKHVSSAASGRCSRVSPSRGLVEGRVCVPPSPVRRRLLARLLRSFSTWFRVLTSPSLHRDFFRHLLLSRRPHHESVLRTSLSHLPSASHAAQTFCHLRDAWLVLLSRRDVLLVLDLFLRSVITAAACS